MERILGLTQAIGVEKDFEVDFTIASVFSGPLNFSQVGKVACAQIFCHTEVRKIFALGW